MIPSDVFPTVPRGPRLLITVHCIWCATEILDLVGRRGRPRQWCGAGCRNKAYRARLILAEHATGGNGDGQPAA